MEEADASSWDVAIAHDKVTTNGGAERVAYEMARTFDAPIYAMRVDEGIAPDDVEVHCLADGIGDVAMRRNQLAEDVYQMLAWQNVPELYEYDTVIENKTNPYWFVPKDTQTIVRYCHSTPRNLYDRFHRHGRGYLAALLAIPQRTFFRQTLPYADLWLANSDLVARRVDRYFGLEPPRVIYPPVDVDALDPDAAPTREYLFSIGRLDATKRIDRICAAADRLDRHVVVAGRGPERQRLERRAPDNVEFLGFVSEEEKRRRLAEAKATIMISENEDFGLVPIESFAAGTPVIGVREGFTRHQVHDGKNGYLCPADPGVDDLVGAIDRLDDPGLEWSDAEIEAYADQFGASHFRERIRDAVAHARETSRVGSSVELPNDESGSTTVTGGERRG